MKFRFLAAALTAFLAMPALAQAASGFATANVNMRSGPSTAYPAVVVIPVGARLQIYGCLSYDSWCDVSFAGGRGWVSGRYIQATYNNNRVYIDRNYYRGLGIPIITFDIDDYWSRNYRQRDFYRERDVWRREPPRRPPPPYWDDPRPIPGGGYRPQPGWIDNDRPRPGRPQPDWDNGGRPDRPRPDRPRPDWDNGDRPVRPQPGFFDNDRPRQDRPRPDQDRPERPQRPRGEDSNRNTVVMPPTWNDNRQTPRWAIIQQQQRQQQAERPDRPRPEQARPDRPRPDQERPDRRRDCGPGEPCPPAR